MMRRAGERCAAAMLAALTLLACGCATLPELQPLLHGREPGTPQVLTATRALSDEQTKAILARLREQGRKDLVQRHLAFTEAISGSPLIAGNELRLLLDGPHTHEAMHRAMKAARDHIHLETYILRDDVVGRELADLLIAKRAQGVEVNLIYDSVGALGTPEAFFARLRAAGVRCLEFNPVNPLKGREWRVNHRDHRKILVVDGRVAFTGGVNFDGVYASSPERRPSPSRAPNPDAGWRDTHLEIRGPAVAAFQRLFLDTWRKQNGPELAARDWFPRVPAQGDKLVQVISSSPDDQESVIYLVLLSALTHADRSIHITMAYFVPDPETLQALKDAARRGVDVKLVLPGFSDFWGVFHAGRSHYSELLEAGVKIYERRDALLHAKTAVIDGVWSTVGSANMDLRSFLHNDEVNAVVVSDAFARQMEAMFQADLAAAVPVEPQRWARRGPALWLQERLARLWAYWL